MKGDVWVKENDKGERVLCIDKGNSVIYEEVIYSPPAENKIKNN
tara:strand:- start:145 stop:276 length:132 start_codon:yes stop_codon:yes gene_type:complete